MTKKSNEDITPKTSKKPTTKKTETKIVYRLNDLVVDYVRGKKMLQAFDAEYAEKAKPVKDALDKLKPLIMEELTRSGQLSAKFEEATISKTKRKKLVITNKNELLRHLEMEHLTQYIETNVNDLFWDSLAKHVEKGTLPLLPGTDLSVTESITYSAAKPNKERTITYAAHEKLPPRKESHGQA